MSLFPFLHVFGAIAYLHLAAYIYIKNPKALVNRLCVATLLCFFVWTVPLVFLHNPYVSKDTARIAANISSFGWCSFSSFYLWFMIVFTGKKEILKKKWFYLLIFGLPLVFIYKQWTGFLITDYSMHYYGWKTLWSKTIWPHLFYIYYLSFLTAAFYLNIDLIRRPPNKTVKKQASIIFVAAVIETILGSVTDVFLPLLNIHVIPNIANILLFIWGSGAVYAITRYKFLTITPATAADNILSTMHDSLILLNMNREIIMVNNAASDLLGYEADELKGKPLDILFGKEELTNGLFKKIVKQGSLKNKDLIFKTRQGKEVPMLFSVSTLKDEAGNLAGIVCVAKDISERKKLAEEIFKRKKLESIGMLAGGIAHDYNNLFTIVVGNLTLARDHILSGKKSHKLVLKAEQASLKAAELARKFLTFSSGGWLIKEKVELSHILKDTRDSESLKMNRIVIYNIDIPNDLMPIYGDREQLTQVMQNLILNAAAAIEELSDPQRGKISVRAENSHVEDVKDEKSTIILLKKGKYVKILVEDNGIGISPGNIEKIFDPYFTTRDTTDQKGMGLGLTLCYSIIKKHNGHITVESEIGKGTTVTLYLPAYMEI